MTADSRITEVSVLWKVCGDFWALLDQVSELPREQVLQLEVTAYKDMMLFLSSVVIECGSPSAELEEARQVEPRLGTMEVPDQVWALPFTSLMAESELPEESEALEDVRSTFTTGPKKLLNLIRDVVDPELESGIAASRQVALEASKQVVVELSGTTFDRHVLNQEKALVEDFISWSKAGRIHKAWKSRQ